MWVVFSPYRWVCSDLHWLQYITGANSKILRILVSARTWWDIGVHCCWTTPFLALPWPEPCPILLPPHLPSTSCTKLLALVSIFWLVDPPSQLPKHSKLACCILWHLQRVSSHWSTWSGGVIGLSYPFTISLCIMCELGLSNWVYLTAEHQIACQNRSPVRADKKQLIAVTCLPSLFFSLSPVTFTFFLLLCNWDKPYFK